MDFRRKNAIFLKTSKCLQKFLSGHIIIIFVESLCLQVPSYQAYYTGSYTVNQFILIDFNLVQNSDGG